MLLGLPQSVATLMSILLFYVMDFLLIRRFDRLRAASGSGRAGDFTFFIFVMTAVLVLQPVLLPMLGFRTTERWGLIIQIIGIAVILDSLALHVWSRRHLGHFYAERVEIQPAHKVIDTGPYKHMRHPVITSFFGIAAGLFLINPSLTTLAAFGYTVWDFMRAARREETLLTKNLPGYAEYARQTPRFLPRLWKRR